MGKFVTYVALAMLAAVVVGCGNSTEASQEDKAVMDRISEEGMGGQSLNPPPADYQGQ